MSKARKTFDQARRAVRDFTGEGSVGEFRRMFDQDAVEAYEVLSREHRASEPEDGFERSWHRVRAFFVGLSSKLSPARRLLFILGVALLLWGLVDLFAESSGENGPDVALLLSALIFFYLFTMEIVDRVRVRDELEVAKELQRGLLPVRGPELDDYRFAHSYRTANEVGGDYYDFLPLSGERLALVVGDASGHGMAAGLLMAIANATLKTALDVDPEPLRAMGILNRTLCRTGDRRSFMSLCDGRLFPDKG